MHVLWSAVAWFSGLLLLTAALLLATRRFWELSTKTLTLSDLASIVAVLIAVGSAAFGIAVYLDTAESSAKQLQALNSAVSALQTETQLLSQAKAQLAEQVNLAEKQSQSLERQLKIAEMREKRELERLSMKPQIEIAAGGVTVFRSGPWITELLRVPKFGALQGNRSGFNLDVRNIGRLAAHQLVVKCERKTYPYLRRDAREDPSAGFPVVTLQLGAVGIPNPNVHLVEGYITLGPIDLRPVTLERRVEVVPFETTVPSNIARYQVFCDLDEELIGRYSFSFVVETNWE